MKLVAALFGLIFLAAFAQANSVKWANVRPVSKIGISSLKNTVRSSKIIGGDLATAGQFPWQAGLYLDGSGFCGGSLISSRVILTAGHCVDGVRDFTVHLGTLDIEATEAVPPMQIISSRNATKHEFYDKDTLMNDIAIIVLPSDVSGQGIAPIRLPARSQIGESFAEQTGRVSGWGRTKDLEHWITQFLRFVDVTIIHNEDCQTVYGDLINDSKLCIDTAGGEKGICFGDSGGPMVVFEADGEPTEVGVVSFVADEGCEAGFPSGFTRVSEYLNWLEKHGGIAIRD